MWTFCFFCLHGYELRSRLVFSPLPDSYQDAYNDTFFLPGFADLVYMHAWVKKERAFLGPLSLEESQLGGEKGHRVGYDRAFWLAYVANFLVSVAVSILYRYGDFIRLIGGTEYQLGWIVGVGMVGSLTARLALGRGIDRRGPKLVWLLSLAGFSAICFAHLAIARPDTPTIYLLRIGYCLTVAGIYGAAMTFVSGRVPVVRMAEMIGILGTAGFMGMLVGAEVGDWLCGWSQMSRQEANRLFVAAGVIGLGAMAFAVLATNQLPAPGVRRREVPIAYLIWRYQPGAVLAVALITGASLGWPSTFLATYTAQVGIARIGPFFTLYSLAAVLTRVVTRRWPEQIGLAPLLIGGLGIIGISQFLFLLVKDEWTLMVPGLIYGIGHGIVFPTLVASGCRNFPQRHRGLGTMLIMSAFDLGTMVGSPMVGAVIYYAPQVGLPGYPTLFVLIGIVLIGTAGVYGMICRPETHRQAMPAVGNQANQMSPLIPGSSLLRSVAESSSVAAPGSMDQAVLPTKPCHFPLPTELEGSIRCPCPLPTPPNSPSEKESPLPPVLSKVQASLVPLEALHAGESPPDSGQPREVGLGK